MSNFPTRRCGAIQGADGSIQWRVWAPHAKRVELALLSDAPPRVVAMTAEEDGYFTHAQHDVLDGQRYAFRLDGGEDRQDPCSLWQPLGVPGPSAVVKTHSFEWADQHWKGIARADLTVYEMHIGAFSPEGTFEAAISRLAAIKELGITAIEIMPIAQFPGSRNWGYDGVLPYAAQSTYGGPRAFAKFVDAAHAIGLAVILDVVYNHLGPEANYVHEFGPYFNDRYKTPWGQAVNYDDAHCDAVRDWVLDNVRMWLDEFHLDGLRLDAVHAIYDLGARHILHAIKNVADEVSQRKQRPIHIIAESDLNDPRVVLSAQQGGHDLDAQWSDDFHHAIHAYLTGESRGYYCDYGKPQQLSKVMLSPFLFEWEHSRHRGRKHGAPVPNGISGDCFVVCIQNHDQVGNRAKGDRLTTLLNHPAKLRLAASLMLLAPYVPMLFMGEEYGETNPFPFFCSFNGKELIEAVRQGRRREFADFVADPNDVPDPNAEETFKSAKLQWSWRDGSPQAAHRLLYADLLQARRAWLALKDFSKPIARLLEGNVLELKRAGNLLAYFNLTDRPTTLPTQLAGSILFSSAWARYGGERNSDDIVPQLLPYEAIAVGPAEWKRIR